MTTSGKRTKARRPGAPKASPKRIAAMPHRPETADLQRQLDDALEQLSATSEVLHLVSDSRTDLSRVFDTILANATRLCAANFGILSLREGDAFRVVALHNAPRDFAELRRREPVIRPGPVMRVVATKQLVHIADITEHPAFKQGDSDAVAFYQATGVRTLIVVPMLKENEVAGIISVYRKEVRPFADRQIALLTNFAAQAVIAIENTRLLNELRQRTDDLTESLEQQTATSEVLSAISSSRGELSPVFETMLENATRICGAHFGNLLLYEGGGAFRIVAMHGAQSRWSELRRREPVIRPRADDPLGRLAATRQLQHVTDLRDEPAYIARSPGAVAAVELGGIRTLLAVPILKGDELVGMFAIYRHEVRPFGDKQIELVESFADQAVIAIENARLLSELRESLEQQTATSEVLRVISSSPGDLEPVFEAMLDNATRICDAKFGNLWLREDDKFRIVAVHGSPEYRDHLFAVPLVSPDPDSAMARIANSRQPVQIEDISKAPTHGMRMRIASIEIAKARTLVGVPMLKDNEVVGIIAIYRQDVRPFNDKQIALLTNFAAQAVIAIENARLLTELRESLEQQTATADVLGVISRSPGDLNPVFQAMLENAARVCDAKFGTLFQLKDGAIVPVGSLGAPQPLLDFFARGPVRPGPDAPITRAVATKQPVHVLDFSTERVYLDRDPAAVAGVELAGIRTLLVVPMLKESELIGAFAIYRQEVRAFTDKQIELVKNFAAQAVIAIENTRLLTELRQRTADLSESLEQQTATSEVLRVISSSPGDLEPVFAAMLANAARICDATFGNIYRWDGEVFNTVATHNTPPAFAEARRRSPPRPSPTNIFGRIVATKSVVHTPDAAAEEVRAVEQGDTLYDAAIELGHVRSVLLVPLLKENELIGAFSLSRTKVRPFTDKQIALVTSFASQAVIAIENARLLNELRESLEQQTATSDVLRVISSSPGELAPVFNAILDSATRICGAKFGVLLLFGGGLFEFAAEVGTPPEFTEFLTHRGRFQPAPVSQLFRVLETKRVSHTADYAADAPSSPPVVYGGARSTVDVPMLKDGELAGVISIYRQEVQPFTDKQIELLQNFANQAVIAIENARLLSELRESLEQQTATSDVLRAISSSPGELEPVFQAMLKNGTQICQAKFGALWLRADDGFRVVATHDFPPEYSKTLPAGVVGSPGSTLPVARAARTRQPVHVHDLREDQSYLSGEPVARNGVEIGHVRTLVVVPMLKDRDVVGAFAIFRQEVRPFGDKQIELLTNFATQAVIAIENARLLSELRQRTDDLTESLERQTATSEVLRVISSSPGELGPVFAAMLENAVSICEASFGAMQLREGEEFRRVAMHNAPQEFLEFHRKAPVISTADAVSLNTLITTRQVIHVTDVREQDPETPIAKYGGARTLLVVPLLKEDALIGAFGVYRQEVRPFTDKQIELVENFAAQAVIAIENARLLGELRQRTDDLSESLEQQTATSEVLQVISSSPGELAPVFNAILDSATRICEAKFGVLNLYEKGGLRTGAMHNVPPAFAEFLRSQSTAYQPMPGSLLDRVLRTKEVAQTADNAAEAIGRAATLGGARSCVCVPMLKDDALIGTITIFRQKVRPFTDKQIALVTSFAAQAVIAIENARLLSELRESLERQTATSEVLGVISRSKFELQPILQSVVDTAERLCRAEQTMIFRLEGAVYRFAAGHSADPAYLEMERKSVISPGPGTVVGRAAAARKVVRIDDAWNDPLYEKKEQAKFGGVRSMIGVPLMRDGEPIGVIALARNRVDPFSDREIELVTTFADQAVIAIENVRLFEAEQERTRELTESLEQQTATSEVLQVISSSPGDLEPVFATMLEKAVRICDGTFGNIYRRDGDALRLVSSHNTPSDYAEMRRRPFRADQRTVIGRLILTKAPVHVVDLSAEAPYLQRDPVAVAAVEVGGVRSVLAVPMLKEDELVGAFIVSRQEVRPFTEKQIELVTSFAAQAVIAIENARLLSELRRSLERQTATSDILRIISQSPTDARPAFEGIAVTAARLLRSDQVFVMLRDGDVFSVVAGASPEGPVAEDRLPKTLPIDASANFPSRAIIDGKMLHLPDWSLIDLPEHELEIQRKFGIKSALYVPLLREGKCIGLLTLAGTRPNLFGPAEIAQAESFRDQALIAIENTRLFNELRSRTAELARSVEELRALGETSQAVNSTLDLETVLNTIVAKAVQLSAAEAGAIYVFDEAQREFHLRATYGMDQALIDAFTHRHIDMQDPNVAAVMEAGEPIEVADLKDEAATELNEISLRAGYRARLVAPLVRGDEVVGMLVVRRRAPGGFAQNTVDLMKTFAAQSALAIQNARLFREIDDKGRQLEVASKHKSQFLANMSHELRTPLNAILGYTELILDNIYGEAPEKMREVLERVQSNGKHLLGLINDVLDLSKIEAGQLTLSLADYSIAELVRGVYVAVEPLAAQKNLALKTNVAKGLPVGRGDERRLAQVLLNLVGNAIKFTDKGEVAIEASCANGAFNVAVRDSGPGIAAADQAKIFEEFQQIDNTSTRQKGGTGLGLSISRRIVEMHGGRILVESQLGKGSTFTIKLPVKAASEGHVP